MKLKLREQLRQMTSDEVITSTGREAYINGIASMTPGEQILLGARERVSLPGDRSRESRFANSDSLARQLRKYQIARLFGFVDTNEGYEEILDNIYNKKRKGR